MQRTKSQSQLLDLKLFFPLPNGSPWAWAVGPRMRIHSESVKSRDIRHVRQLSQQESKTKGRMDGRTVEVLSRKVDQ